MDLSHLQTLEGEFFRQKEEQREFYCQTSSSDEVYMTNDGEGIQNGGTPVHPTQRQMSQPPLSTDVHGAGIY